MMTFGCRRPNRGRNSPRPIPRPLPIRAARRPRGRPAGLASRPARAEAPAPQSLPPASPAPTSAAAAREVASVAPGSRLVQLGAFDSEGLARQVWSQLTQAHGDLLGSRSLFL